MMIRSAMPLAMPSMQSGVLTFLMLGLLSWPPYVRINYAGAMSARASDWMIQGRAMGLRKWQLALRYLAPHLRSLTSSQFLMLIPVCLVAEANLGTLGLGIAEPLPSYGSMLLALQRPAALAGSHWSCAPILLLVLVLSLIELMVVEA
jgi:ABC-type dipeptide/oligopeptide/nickel transport system permease subunit